MQSAQLPDHIVYSPAVIEFVTVAAETCLFLEQEVYKGYRYVLLRGDVSGFEVW